MKKSKFILIPVLSTKIDAFNPTKAKEFVLSLKELFILKNMRGIQKEKQKFMQDFLFTCLMRSRLEIILK